jgi:hypothetical protein
MDRTFAGFWRDGAKVKPEEDHWKKRRIVACWKDSEWYEVLSDRFTNWHQVYWLDTTTPTELSPQEAFELCKVVWPNLKQLHRTIINHVDVGKDCINWGDLTEYPPRKRWRVPTEADRGKKCRYKDHENGEWIENDDRVFWSNWPNGFLVQADGKYPITYRYCEVLDS